MHHKFGVALKECRESQYWIDVLEESNLLHKERWALVQALLNEVTAMLVASRKTLKKQLR
jgi:four helix bundle protein